MVIETKKTDLSDDLKIEKMGIKAVISSLKSDKEKILQDPKKAFGVLKTIGYKLTLSQKELEEKAKEESKNVIAGIESEIKSLEKRLFEIEKNGGEALLEKPKAENEKENLDNKKVLMEKIIRIEVKLANIEKGLGNKSQVVALKIERENLRAKFRDLIVKN